MNTLDNKQYSQNSLNYISRYSNFPFYFNLKDQKYMRGLTANLSKDTPYILVDINQWTTLDMLSEKYYGRPDYFWIIADFNSIQDPFESLQKKFKQIKIPGISQIVYNQ